MNIGQLKEILNRAIEYVDDYPLDAKVVMKSNTYGIGIPFLGTRQGYISLNDIDVEEDEMEESINEKRGFLRKYRGCSIHDMGDVYVVTNENGLTIGQERTELGAEAIIDEYLKNKQVKLEKKGYTIKEDGKYKETFDLIFPVGSFNSNLARKTMYDIGAIVKKYLEQDCEGNCFYLLKTILRRLLFIIFEDKNNRKWKWIKTNVDETIMKYFDDEDLGTKCVREVLRILDEV